MGGEEGVEGIAREVGAGRCAGAGIYVVEHEVHGLVGPLFGAHGPEFVLHGYVVVCREVEGHVHLFECAGDAQSDVEVDKAGVFALAGDVCPDLVDGFDREHGIEHGPVEGHIASRHEVEVLFGDDGERVAYEAVVDGEPSGQASVGTHRGLGVGEDAVALDLHPVLSVSGQVGGDGGALAYVETCIDHQRH